MFPSLPLAVFVAALAQIPADFPTFVVPGHEREMESLRALFALHHPGAGPKATLWDAWLPAPAIWPATADGARFIEEWKAALAAREIDADGYVATHQHPSIAHPQGWPFPFWNQGGGVGWHWSFEDTVGPPWRTNTLATSEGLVLDVMERGPSRNGTDAHVRRIWRERERERERARARARRREGAVSESGREDREGFLVRPRGMRSVGWFGVTQWSSRTKSSTRISRRFGSSPGSMR